MARSIVLDRHPVADRHEAVIAEYRERLAQIPPPESSYRWPPIVIGPTWKRGKDGRFLLPEKTIGWDVLGWCGTWLQHRRDVPWRFTDEQARFILWWMSLEDDGEFTYHDFVLQRLKGWGKDPLGACLLAVEMLGPCRFDGWDREGNPIARDVSDAWVQTVAVSLEQTKNTMRLVPSLFTPEAKEHFGLQIGKERIYALGDERFWEAVTSSPRSLEGARGTYLLLNETQHWDSSNGGHEMSATIARNADKSPDGAARTGRITNAYQPGKDSVAERDRRAWEQMEAGETLGSGLLYDSLEAAPEAPLTAEAAPYVIDSIKGDSKWLNTPRIVKAILDPRNPASQSRRFWYNQITAKEDAWIAPIEWDACAKPGRVVEPGELITLGFDGSKSKDTTALIGCCISDSHLFTIEIWNPLVLKREVPTTEVDAAVVKAFADYDVVGFYGDVKEWESYIDKWERDFGEGLCAHATERHPIRFDMRGSQLQVTKNAEAFLTAVVERDLSHSGEVRLGQQIKNARSVANNYGVNFDKESPNSTRSVDAADAAVLARRARQDYLALPENKRRQKLTGEAFFV